MSCEKLNINGTEYVRSDCVKEVATPLDGKPFVIIRSHGAGVFAGYLRAKDDTLAGRVVTMDQCIRLHQWNGCSLSQVSIDGPVGTNVENHFSMPTDNHQIVQVIEMLECTEKARLAIQAVKTWKK